MHGYSYPSSSLICLLSVWAKTLGQDRDTCGMRKHNYRLTLRLADDLRREEKDHMKNLGV